MIRVYRRVRYGKIVVWVNGTERRYRTLEQALDSILLTEGEDVYKEVLKTMIEEHFQR